MDREDKLIEYLCRVMHTVYEEQALIEGWDTHRDSRGDWSAVPEANKATMRAAMRSVLAEIGSLGGRVPTLPDHHRVGA